MWPTTIVLPFVLAALGLFAPAAGAGTERRHVAITQTVAVLSTQGSVVATAGTASGTPGGRGALRGRTTVEGNVYTTKLRSFFRDGTISAVSILTPSRQPDGSTSFGGTGTFTGGTGRYRGARGRYTVTANVPANSTVGTFRLTGSIRYRRPGA